MATPRVPPTGVETFFGEDELIVSKTDLKGVITYANDVFIRTCGYSEAELLGAPHSIIRHPKMPRCVFKLLWDTIEAGREIFAYVVNLAKNGNHYWVLAHVTPTFDASGQIIGYHSNRRVPARSAVDKVIPIYDLLLKTEAEHAPPREGMQASLALMVSYLESQKVTYDEFVWSLIAEGESAHEHHHDCRPVAPSGREQQQPDHPGADAPLVGARGAAPLPL